MFLGVSMSSLFLSLRAVRYFIGGVRVGRNECFKQRFYKNLKNEMLGSGL